jgi:hypothetical protein
MGVGDLKGRLLAALAEFDLAAKRAGLRRAERCQCGHDLADHIGYVCDGKDGGLRCECDQWKP